MTDSGRAIWVVLVAKGWLETEISHRKKGEALTIEVGNKVSGSIDTLRAECCAFIRVGAGDDGDFDK